MTSPDGGDVDADSEASDADVNAGSTARHAVILDYLPHGRAEERRYDNAPLAYALGIDDFRLYELRLDEDADESIGDRVVVAPASERETVEELREVGYDDVSNTAHAELEYVVEEIVEEDERRFVDFYNDAQPITLRLHQLNLLPGIGKKLRNNILDERKRGPFESFEDLEARVSGLHHAKDVLVERIMEELRDDDLKYKTFVGRDDR
jgi:putative nucleotide binding protein